MNYLYFSVEIRDLVWCCRSNDQRVLCQASKQTYTVYTVCTVCINVHIYCA